MMKTVTDINAVVASCSCSDKQWKQMRAVGGIRRM